MNKNYFEYSSGKKSTYYSSLHSVTPYKRNRSYSKTPYLQRNFKSSLVSNNTCAMCGVSIQDYQYKLLIKSETIIEMQRTLLNKNRQIQLLQELIQQKNKEFQQGTKEQNNNQNYINEIKELDSKLQNLYDKCQQVTHLNSQLRVWMSKYMEKNVDRELVNKFTNELQKLSKDNPQILGTWLKVKSQVFLMNKEYPQQIIKTMHEKPELTQRKPDIMSKLLIKKLI